MNTSLIEDIIFISLITINGKHMLTRPIIYWLRNDLRLHDNPALLKALEDKRPIVPVFILDDLWYDSYFDLGFSRTGEKRGQFLKETLVDLKNSLEQKGNTLYIFKGHSVQVLSTLYDHLKAQKIIVQKEFAWEEIEMEKQLASKTDLDLVWGSMLYQPDQVYFPVEKSPFYYTKFKNKVIGLPFSPASRPTPEDIPELKGLKLPGNLQIYHLHHDKNSANSFFKGGESQGLLSINKYLQEKGPLHYADTRNNLEGKDFSSQLGPWLANGALSPRILYERLIEMQNAFPEEREQIQLLINQLIWRDYFRFLFLRYGKKLFSTKGLRKTAHGMENDMEAFKQWKNGNTDQPLINALMRELKETGFMSNRGRMLVSFYLAKEMKVNWQWGAEWFESILLDYDVCSNYGNWAYQSGRGTDSRVNRRFNLKTQAKKFDPNESYIRKWVRFENE
jgi:deoxyribodipyrimidine photo-lyase